MAQTLGNLLINVEANTTQLVQGFNRAENVVNKTTKNMGTAIKTLAAAYVSLEAVDLAKSYARQVDELTNVNNRLKLVTKSSEEFASVQKELFNQSQINRSMYTGTIDLYGRIAKSTQNLALSQKELLNITDSINKAMIIGGGSAESQRAALIQLGQAFSSNFKAVGQELGSIREQAPRLYEVMIKGTLETNKQFKALVDNGAEASGVFKKWAEDGKLSSEIVINALKNQGIILDSEFSQMSMTIEQSMVTARNSLQKLIYDFDQTSGISATVSKTINDISKSMDSLDAETIVKIAEGFKDGAIAVATMYASIKATSAGFAAYGAITQKITEWNKASVEYELAKTKAINLGEQAVKARKLADEALNASRRSGLVIAEKQYLLLEKEATKLEAAAKKQQALSYSLESTARGFNVAAIASNAFKTALASIPFMAVSIAIGAVATALLSASKASETLESTLKASGEELKKLTFNQLQYRKELVEEELIKSRIDLADSKARAAKKNANAEDKAARDEAIINFEEQTKKLREIKQIQDELSKPTISSTKTETTTKTEAAKPTAISDELQRILDKSVLIKKKYADLRLELESSGRATAENIKILADAENKEIEALNKKSNTNLIKGNEEKLSQYLNYYEKIGEYAKLWQLEEQRIREENYLLKQDEINKLIELERAAFEAKANASGIEAAQTDINYQERKLQLQAESYEKEVALAELQYANNILNVENLAKTREEKDYLLSLEYELYNATLERLRAEDEMANIEKVAEDKESMLDYQLSLIDAADSWGNSLGGVAGQIGNVIGAYNKMSKIALNSQKQQLKLDTNLAKTKEKYGEKSIEYIEAENKHIMDTSALKQEKQNAEIAGYANLAGAMASAFEQGSAGAIAFTTLQATLGIASSWTAIATAWALPFPVNMAAVATVASAVMPIIAQLTSMGGSGSGGGGTSISVPSVAGEKQAELDFENKMITDRLDRQIELLEQLNLQGSTSKLKNISSGIQFQYDKDTARNTIRKVMEENLGNWQSSVQVSIFNSQLGNVGYSGDLIDYFMADSPVKVWEDYANKYNNGLGAWFSPYMDVSQRQFKEMQNDFQGSISEFISSVVDSVQTVQEQGEKLRDIYDELTDSSKYADERLSKALKRVDSLRGQYSFAEYIENQIANIELLKDELSDKNISLLLSQDIKDMRAQIELVNQISAKTGLVFENGAEDVLNYIDAIEMLSEATVTSRNNIKSFIDSFKSEDLLAKDLSISFGEDLAKNWDELKDKLVKMSSDEFGLTDDELEFLETNKAYIERLQDLEEEGRKEALESQKKLNETLKTEAEKTLSEIKSNISKITNTLNTLGKTIDRLRGNADTTNTYDLNKFYESMAKTQELLKGEDYEAISKSIQETVGYSSALSDAKNFTLTRDMQYAQLVAAKQFEDMDITLNEELDYLKMIEENTAKIVESLKSELEKVTETFTQSNSTFISALGVFTDAFGNRVVGSFSQSISDLYTKYDLHRLQSDTKGYEYWEKLLASGVSLAEIEKNILFEVLKQGVEIPAHLKNLKSIYDLYTKYDLHRLQADTKGYEYWEKLLESGVSLAEIEKSILIEMTKQGIEIPAHLKNIDGSINKNLSSIYDLYTKYDLHRLQADTKGYEYWASQLNSGKSLEQVEKEIIDVLKNLGITVSTNTNNSSLNTSSSTVSTNNNNNTSNNSSSNTSSSTTNTNNNKKSAKELIYDIYTKYDLHKFQTDQSGYQYWEKMLNQGVALNKIESEIRTGAKSYLAGQNTQVAKAWLNTYPKLYSFDVGTPNVPRDMLAQIHQGEIITPKTYSDGIRNGDLMMGDVSSIESALEGISNSVNALVGIANSQLMQLRDIRDISNGSLVSLQNLEAII